VTPTPRYERQTTEPLHPACATCCWLRGNVGTCAGTTPARCKKTRPPCWRKKPTQTLLENDHARTD